MAYDLIREHGLSIPVIQAPMAGTSTPELAAVVSMAGGMGSLAIGTLTPAAAQRLISHFRALTSRPFNVNVFCHKPATGNAGIEESWLEALSPVFHTFGATPPTKIGEIYRSFVDDESTLDLLLTERPAVVSFHFDLPDQKFVRALRDKGIRLWATATKKEEAFRCAEAGIDAIVAQGFEAGGHRGVFDPDGPDPQLGTFALVRLLAATLDIPIIAAGGIMDGAGIFAALSLGAVAAQLGTAFIACPESAADDGYRAKLRSDAACHTVITRHISGRPARCLANGFTALGSSLDDVAVPDYPIAYDAGKALNAAAKKAGSSEYGAHWAGQGAPLSRSLPAGELIAAFRAELASARALRKP